MSDHLPTKGYRHLSCEPVAVLLIVTGLITQCHATPLPPDTDRCDENDDPRCCGDIPVERDSTCCIYQGAKLYVPVEKCENGFIIGSPTLECGADKTVYHPRYQGCCFGQVYDLQTSKCCAGKKPIPIGAGCCLGHAMEEGDLCCTVGLVRRQHPLHDDCCVKSGNATTYNSQTHICNSVTGLAEEFDKKAFDNFVFGAETGSENDNNKTSGNVEADSEKFLRETDGEDGEGATRDRVSKNENEKTAASKTSRKDREKRRQDNSKNGKPRRHRPRDSITSSLEDNEIDTDADVDGDLSALSKFCLNENHPRDWECCGWEPYSPKEKTCCDGILNHTMPTQQARCCFGKAYRKNDPRNPCIQQCGGRTFDRERQLCCYHGNNIAQAKVYDVTDPLNSRCCGDVMINSRNFNCCGNQPLRKNGGYNCCQNHHPYHKRSMECDVRTGTVTMKDKPFLSRVTGKTNFVKWYPAWRQPRDQTRYVFIGRVERCGIKLKGNDLILPLTPVITKVGGAEISDCFEGSLRVVLKMACQKGCRSEREWKRYLRGKTLHFSVKDRRTLDHVCRGRKPTLTIENGDIVTILISKEFDPALKDILRH